MQVVTQNGRKKLVNTDCKAFNNASMLYKTVVDKINTFLSIVSLGASNPLPDVSLLNGQSPLQPSLSFKFSRA